MLNHALPLRHLHIDWAYAQAVTLRIFYQYSRHVKTHGLIVENRTGERSQVTHLEISGRVGNQREAGGVRFRKAIKREGSNVLNNGCLSSCIEAVFRHATT